MWNGKRTYPAFPWLPLPTRYQGSNYPHYQQGLYLGLFGSKHWPGFGFVRRGNRCVSGLCGHIHPGIVNAVRTESQTISIYSFFSLRRIRTLTGNNLWDANSEVAWIGRRSSQTWSLVASSRLLTTMCRTRLTTDSLVSGGSSSANSPWPLHRQEGTDQLLRKQK